MNEPLVAFPQWTPWSKRPRLSDCLDVPDDFDFGGLYLFARFFPGAPAANLEASHLSPEVIYIGMSKRLTGRTQNHEKIARSYKTQFDDQKCQSLYYAHCDLGPGWSSWDLSHREGASVKRAYLQYAERKLIWEYARKFNRLPLLNKT